VHGALKWKQSRCGDGKTLEMSLTDCMRSLGLRWIFEVDKWTQPCITMKVLCKFVELQKVNEGSSCRDSFVWVIEGPRHQT
jgi:hypothetical protein